jgi:hypothetical protein
MATGTLVDHSLGLGLESTPGVAVAPTRFLEWLESSDLSSGWDMDVKHGQGLRQGSVFARAARSVSMVPRGKGKLLFEFGSKGFGLPLRFAFGTAASALVSGSAYQELFTPTTTANTLDSFSAQEGIVRSDGTIVDYTSSGCTVSTWTIAVPQDGIATLAVDVDMRGKHVSKVFSDGATTNANATLTSATAGFVANDVGKNVSGAGIPAATTIIAWVSSTQVTMSANATATAAGVSVTLGVPYTTPSYASTWTLFSAALPAVGGVQVGTTASVVTVPTSTVLGSMTAATNVVGAKSWELSGDNGIDDKREVIGGRNQPTTGMRKASLKLAVEYDAITGPTFYNAQVGHYTLPLILTSNTTEVIGTGLLAQLQVVIPGVYINKGAIPQPTGGTVPITSLECEIEDTNPGVTKPIYVVLRTADAAL